MANRTLNVTKRVRKVASVQDSTMVPEKRTTLSASEYQHRKALLEEARTKYAETMLQIGEANSYRDHETWTGDAVATITNELRLLSNTIRELEYELNTCEIVEVKHTVDNSGNAIVTYGSRVKLQYLDMPSNNIAVIAFCNITDVDMTKYSPCTPSSPLGQLIKEKPVGFTGAFISPVNGKEVRIKILEVLPHDESLNN